MSISAEQRYYLKLKAVYYYYEKDYTQTEIAEMLSISRITLGKLLKEAKEEGMVKIEIVDVRNVRQHLELEAQIKDKYGLLDVKVVDCVENERNEINRKIAAAAAKYVEHMLKSNMKIGIAWGRTLDMMVDQLNENRNIKNIEVVTLLGGAGTAESKIQPNIIAQRLLEKYKGTGYIMNAPYICQTEELCRAIREEPHISEVLKQAAETDVALIGIGEKPSIKSCAEAGYTFSDDIVHELEKEGAAGDLCANYFNIHGQPCITQLNNRLVSVDLKDFPKMKKVVALGGGPNKWDAVLGALRGGYLDILITDKFTAKSVIERG